MQAPGDYELPGLALSWFDTGSDKVRVARVPALSFSVRPGPPVHTRVTNPSQNPSAVSPAPTWRVRALALIRGDYWRWGGGLAGGLCVLAALGALCWGYRGGAGWLALRRLRGRMLTPERRAFLRSLGALAGARQAAQQLQAIESAGGGWRGDSGGDKFRAGAVALAGRGAWPAADGARRVPALGGRRAALAAALANPSGASGRAIRGRMRPRQPGAIRSNPG
ncbi:MAG: hypothetical protein IPG83_02060 [Novosphingobium sp.]|nr:hypothetical protein [Novosphingobium sp.]